MCRIKISHCFFVAAFLSSCATDQEEQVHSKCKYLRPDMYLSDASDLLGWEPNHGLESYTWTATGKCTLYLDEDSRIVEVYDSYRCKHYFKRPNMPGVFERDLPIEDDYGNDVCVPDQF